MLKGIYFITALAAFSGINAQKKTFKCKAVHDAVKLIDEDYIFQIGDEKAFKEWQTNNKAEYDKFVDWYTADANLLKVNKDNIYLSDQVRIK